LRISTLLPAGLLVMVPSACASPPPPVNTPEPAPTARVLDSVPTSIRPIIWRGTLSPVQTRSGYASAPSVRTKTSGRVELESVGDAQGRTFARLTVTGPTAAATDFRWAILPGRCGGTALPLVGYDVFPAIEVGSNGRGELNQEIPVAMPSGGALHVNIYSSGQQLSEVIACANLRREDT
jgi:hypothetical protein